MRKKATDQLPLRSAFAQSRPVLADRQVVDVELYRTDSPVDVFIRKGNIACHLYQQGAAICMDRTTAACQYPENWLINSYLLIKHGVHPLAGEPPPHVTLSVG